MADAHPLPVTGIVAEVIARLREAGTVIVTAPPGAGKSTLLPLELLKAFPGKILMLEPRRLAARQIAARMAEMLGEPVGKTVGYRIRLEKKVSGQTRLEVLTEGILTRMLVDDPALEGVSTVIFDEFHERSLASDEALALTREARALLREDLRLLLMSATMDTDSMSRSLEAPVVRSEGRMFPVDVEYASEEATPSNVAETVARAVRKAHSDYPGDILAFLPGEGEIRRAAEWLQTALGDTEVLPLYGMLSNEAQRHAIAPSLPGRRKVVLATSIAETSLTIEGVRVVIDSGLCRQPVFDARTSLTRLETVRISLDRMLQRTGRAGRVAPGVCIRLWTKATERLMAPLRTPEILDADLAGTVLSAAAWGESHMERLPWLTPPPLAGVLRAKDLLTNLGALDDKGSITAEGRSLVAFPCHPRMAKMLLSASTPSQRALAADLAALLEERDPLPDAGEAGLDLRVRALRLSGRSGKWGRIARVSQQYATLVSAAPDDAAPDPYEIGALIAAAYPERVAKIWPEGAARFLLATGEMADLDAADPLSSSEWLSVAGLNASTSGPGRIFLAAPVSPDDLRPFAREREIISWDSRKGSVTTRREWRLGCLLLDEKPLQGDIRDRIVAEICRAAVKEGVSMFDFSDAVRSLQQRICAVALWHPSLGLPDVGTEALLSRAPEWLPLYIGKASTVAELRRLDVCQVIWGLLSYEQQQTVDRLAPTHVTVPTGSRIALEYRSGAEAPVLRVRLQECFGLLDTPRVDDGRLPVLMELLSPGYKSVQLTSDLRSFWNHTYYEVRKELRRRYPKHSWPDDPLAALPVRGVRKQR